MLSGLASLAERPPHFCSGCPHNSSTNVPEGSRAFAGIGCHGLVLPMERSTSSSTHMGGEGANWIGLSRYSPSDHVFQNLGDGTYFPSGSLRSEERRVGKGWFLKCRPRCAPVHT